MWPSEWEWECPFDGVLDGVDPDDPDEPDEPDELSELVEPVDELDDSDDDVDEVVVDPLVEELLPRLSVL